MAEYSFDPPHKDIKRHAASGFMFSGLAQANRILVQFVTVIIMARLLNPSDFGLVAKVTPIYAFALLFHDLGLSQATMQRPNLTTEQVNSFFWINVGVGVVITLLLLLASPLIGWFYHDPRTIILTVAMALLVLICGFGNQPGALMTRRMEFREQGIINIVSTIMGLVAAVLWAWCFGNYWALYVGMAVNTIFPVVGTWMYVKWRPTFPALAPETGEMLRYGLGITGGNLVAFAVQNVNSVVIGRVLGDWLLGIYDRSSRLLASPLQQLTAPISGVVVPILYRLHDDGDSYRRTFLRTIGSISFAVLPGVIWAIVLSDQLIGALLGAKWHDATPVFAALCLASLPQLINDAASWLFMTQGRSRDFARWSLFSAMFSFIGLFCGISFGVVGVAIASVIVQFLRTPFLWWYACRTGPVTVRHVISTLLPQVIGGVLSAVALMLLRYLWQAANPMFMLVAGLGLSYIISVLTVAAFPVGRESIRRDIGFAKFMLERISRKPALPE